MPRQAEVVHHIPGRVRVHVPLIKGRPEVWSAIKGMAFAIPGVHRIDANPVTGSILVRYDQHDPVVEQLLTAILEDLDSLLPLIDPESAGAARAKAAPVGDIEGGSIRTPFSTGVQASSSGPARCIHDQPFRPDTMLLTLLMGTGCLSLKDSTSPALLAGLVALSLHPVVDRGRTPRKTLTPKSSGKISDAEPQSLL